MPCTLRHSARVRRRCAPARSNLATRPCECRTAAAPNVLLLCAAGLPAALLVALMIVWATLGHRFASNTRFAGEGSTACLLGLVVGLVLLLARPLFHPEVLQSMLSFDPANFFV